MLPVVSPFVPKGSVDRPARETEVGVAGGADASTAGCTSRSRRMFLTAQQWCLDRGAARVGARGGGVAGVVMVAAPPMERVTWAVVVSWVCAWTACVQPPSKQLSTQASGVTHTADSASIVTRTDQRERNTRTMLGSIRQKRPRSTGQFSRASAGWKTSRRR